MAHFDPANYASTVAALVGAPRLMALDAGAPDPSALELHGDYLATVGSEKAAAPT